MANVIRTFVLLAVLAGTCECSNAGSLSCPESQCKAGEECKEVCSVRTCVASTALSEIKYLYTYMTVFMFNWNTKETSKNQLYITSYLSDTNVLVTVNKTPFKQELSMKGGESVTVEVPSDTELRGTGRYSKTVMIRSSKLITIVSSNKKTNSVDTSLVYPVTKLGQEYYVFTPSARGNPKELAVFGLQDSTSVTVELRCTVTFEGRTYKPNKKLTAHIDTSEVLYLESDQDCTGSRVVSDKPVGVISGHACAWKNSKCQHVFEQLLPVERWATHFFVLPLEYQVLKDSVYVFASASTRVSCQFGKKPPFAIDLKAGQWREILMDGSLPLVMSSPQPIQVLYYCTGGKLRDKTQFDPFMMNIIPTVEFCETYTLEGMEGFSNYALIVAKDIKKVQFDDKHPSFKWQQVHGTEYSWTHYTYEKGRGHHTVKSPGAPIGVYSVGTVDRNSYGAPAACGLLTCTHNGQYYPSGKPFWEDSACTKLCECNPSTGVVSCQKSQCKAEEECKIVECLSECVPKVPPCTHKGQTHPPGKPFWEDSACTELCECDPSTGLVSCQKSQCKAGEECKEVCSVRTCVASTTLSEIKYLYTYMTVFMFNWNTKETSKNQLYITSYLSDTNVLVTVNKTPFKQELSMKGGESVTVEVPSDTELRGTGRYSKTVMIRSSKLITIVSSNQKTRSVDTSLVYPVTKLGQEYYVFTPSARGNPKELAVFGLQDSTSVTVELRCTVTFEGRTYKPNKKLTAHIDTSEVLYLESDQDCTGSRVVSDKPVGVISGHACAWKNSKCQHVFEQLLPVERWATHFFVLPLEYQVLKDSVYVFASASTRVSCQFGKKPPFAIDLKAGQWREILMDGSLPLVMSSPQPIQVLYYCTGGKLRDKTQFDPFMMNIIPTVEFCETYTLEGMEGFSNYALIVAKDIKKVQFDDKHPSFKWQQVHGTEYSWTHYTYEKGRGHHTVKSPGAPIGVYSVGTVDRNSYGAPAACGLLTCTHNGQYYPSGKPFWEDSACTKLCECNPSTGVVSCQKSQCKAEEECKIVECLSECVPKVPPCTHKGQTHPPAKPFWEDSACTELCECDPSTGLVSCQKSQCKAGEECKEVCSVRTCVASTALSEIKYLYTYMTVFMFNWNTKETSKNQLYITSYLSDTNVLVTVNKTPFKQELSMKGGESVTVEVPSDTELRGTGRYSKTVMIRSSKLITIVSSNQKTRSVDTSLVYPVTKLGQEYYVFTPSARGNPKELAVFGLQDSTSVTVELRCTVTFEGRTYKPNKKLTAHIDTSEVLYLESDQDCTGSRVVSDKPVGVISGHACAWKNSKCQHVFEQLLPVERWATHFFVLPLEYQVLKDSVYVFASASTRVSCQFGKKPPFAIDLKAGQWREILMDGSLPLVMSSPQPIQVLYYCTGGKLRDKTQFDPFMMNIIPTVEFCETYTLEGMEGFSNYALIVAKDIKKVQFDDKHPSFKWQQVHGTEYSWTHYTYEKGRGHHTVKSPGAPIGVYSVGTVDRNSYGAPAACGLLTCTHNGQYYPSGKPFWEDSACTKLCECNPSTGVVSCQKSQCKAEEECKIVECLSECVPKVPPCTHKGQTHPPGKPFWEDSACTELCECDPSTGLVSCQKSQCKAGEECKEVCSVRTCVASAALPEIKYFYTYMTVFMFNWNTKETSKNQLYITSYLSDTNVLVTVNKTPFKQELSMKGGESVTVEVPSDTELRGTGRYSKTVMIRSSKLITIVSSNKKTNSVDTSLVYPVTKLGQEYYVFTPSARGNPKELAVFGLQDSTSVTVELRCTVTFEGRTYKPNKKLTAHIRTSEVLYLESDQDCTGSRVVSDKPVGVISGHACAWKNSKCQHVFEQLLPVERWATHFFVLPLEYQVLKDSVYVFASAATRVSGQFGENPPFAIDLRAGQWREILMDGSLPLVMSSPQPIQVLYYCTGGKFRDKTQFDPFMMNIIPTVEFCETYTLEGMEDFSNYALIVAKDIKKVQFDDKHPSFKWQQVHGTEYSWTHYTYEKGRGHHTVKSPGAPIGVYSVGTVDRNSYGAPAACGLLTCTHNGQYYPPGKPFWEDSACTKLCECNPSTGVVSCQKSQCKAEEECKVVECWNQCVAKTTNKPVNRPKVLTCTHNGQYYAPGKLFWDDSACTKLCECDPSTVVVSCQKSQCKAGEECRLVGDVRTCVAKVVLPQTKYPYTYITVFIFNANQEGKGKKLLYITSYLSDTNVLVTVNKSPFKKELTMQGGESVTVELPSDTELRGTGKFSKTVIIHSSKFITIGSSKQKKNSVDTSLVYSMTKSGQEYYVFIPLAWGYPKEVAVFGLQDSTSVTVELKCAVTFEGKTYEPNEKLTARISTSEVLYLNSNQDCTGTRVVSDKPVGVISGYDCASKNSKCQHAFEQLLPVEQWGTSFIVPPVEYQVSVYILASSPTHVTYQLGSKSEDINLSAGQWKEISMDSSPPLVISSTQPVQVLYYCNGGKFSDGSSFDPFIMNIEPNEEFYSSYTLEGIEDVSNKAFIIAMTKDIKEVQFDDKRPSFKWQQVHGTEYSWTQYTYKKGRGHHILMHPSAPIGVYSMGSIVHPSFSVLTCSHNGQYRTPGKLFWEDSACTKLCECDGSTGLVTCKESSCKAGEECKVVGGVSECVATTSSAHGNLLQADVCPDNDPNCDCVYQGKLMKSGEAWMSANCSEKCVCLTGRWVQCEIPGCPEGGSCVEKGGAWLCSTPEPSCYLLPSGAFKSFDGLEDWVWTEATYSLAVPATQDAFRITAHLDPYSDTVEPTVIFPSDLKVEVKKDLTTVVNGKAVSLPFRTDNGLEIVGSENTVVVQHTSGLNLRYCCHGKVTVTLTAAFRGKMAGLCGNFNGRADDDLQLRDGSVADSIEDFYEDWTI